MLVVTILCKHPPREQLYYQERLCLLSKLRLKSQDNRQNDRLTTQGTLEINLWQDYLAGTWDLDPNPFKQQIF